MSSTISSSNIGFSFEELPLLCKVLLVFSFLEAIGGGLAYHIAYFFSVSTTYNKLDIGFLGFFMGVGSILGSLYGGYFTGKYQGQNLLSASFFCMGLAFVFLSIMHDLYFSLLCVFVLGFGINLFVTCSNSSLLQITKKSNLSLSIAQSYKNALENAGGIGAMVLIMFFAQKHFHSMMISVGLFFLFLSIYTYLKISLKRSDDKTDASCHEEIATVYSALAPLLFSVFCIGLTYGIQKTVLGVHLNETIGSSFIIGLFFVTDPILIVIFQVKVSRRVETFNKHAVASMGCVVLGSATLAMGYSSTMLEMFISLVVFTLGEMLFMAHSSALCHQYGGSNHSGLGIGAWRSAYALGMMIGPLVSGVTMFYSTSKTAWTISSLLCLMSAGLVIAAKKN